MRLFYDIDSSRLRAEVSLLAADAGAVAIAVLLATGASPARAHAADLALLVLWAIIPVSIARVLRGMEMSRDPWRRLVPSAMLGLSIAALLALGLELLRSVSPEGSLPDAGLSTVLFLSWGSGFLLFYPRAYRLHDFLLIALVLLGLKEGRSPWILVPLFPALLFLSSFLRHVIHDILPRRRRDSRVNLQNARAVSLVAALATSLVFVAAGLAWSGGRAAFPDPGPLVQPSRDGERRPVPRAPADASREAPERGVHVWELPAGSGSAPADGRSIIGFTHRIGLRELTNARFDLREALRVEPAGGDLAGVPRGRLWKGIALTTFDPRLESWVEETETRRLPWPAGDSLPRPGGEGSPTMRLRTTVSMPVLRSLVVPYGTRAISARFPEYAESRTGDVFPHPKPAAGSTYELAVSRADLMETARRLSGGGAPQRSDPLSAEDAAPCLVLPAPDDVGLDFQRLARRVFRMRAGAPAERVEELRSWLVTEGFRYSNAAGWRGKHPLARFLEREKVGDCAYFATASALLLRAAGIPARLAAGFSGGERAGSALVLRQSHAHAWVEVFSPDAGWRPVDPTAWVDPDPSYVPEPEAPSIGLARSPLFQHTETDAGASAETGAWAGGGEVSSAPRAGDALPDEPRRTTPLAPHEEMLLTESVRPGDEEGWVSFSEFVVPDDAGPAEDTFLAAPGGGSPEDPAGARRAVLDERLRTGAPLPAPGSSGLPAPLRLAVVVAGGVVAFLLIRAFLRPEKDEEEALAEEEGEELRAPEPGATSELELDESDPRDRVLGEYLRLQAALERTRKHRRPSQTPLEHARCAGRGAKGAAEPFLTLYRILYRLVYGNADIEEEDAEAAAESTRKLRRILG